MGLPGGISAVWSGECSRNHQMAQGRWVTGENRLKIAKLLALLDMLSERFIDEPASWLEMPITDGVGMTRMDLLERGRYDLVLDLASPHTGDGTTDRCSMKSIRTGETTS